LIRNGISADDPLVARTLAKAPVDWIRRHYRLDENLGQGQAGLYYYYHTFGKALHARGEDPLTDAAGVKRHWRNELFEALRTRQRADGSWRNPDNRSSRIIPTWRRRMRC
jgi:squalene-hopene/tetraprenyl-beta-curcumene cyclase